MWIRALLLLLPLSSAWLTWWAAEKVRENRALRRGDLVALLSDSEMPQLNPFLPTTEADHQLAEVIHAPLIRVGATGHIEPALASDWRWLKRVTIWFGTPGEAMNAKARLLEVRGKEWPRWKLENVESDTASLRLTYSDPMFGSVREALRTAKARLIPVVIIRVESANRARELRTALVTHPTFAPAVQRAWPDGDSAFEIAVTGVTADYTRDLRKHLEQSLPENTPLEVSVKSQQPMLEEPVLEFSLEDDAYWHDGRRVSARDVKATFDAVTEARLPVPDVESLRVVRAVEVMAPNRVHVVYWRHRGPAMCAWLGLPILPEDWLKIHPLDLSGRVFRDSTPLGAGPCAVEQRDYQSLVLRAAKNDSTAKVRRLSLVTNLSEFSTQLGYSTNALDLFWPSPRMVPDTQHGESLTPQSSPPRESIRLLFNTRHAPLDEPQVREALAFASDRQALATQSMRGLASPHYGLFAPGLWLSSSPPALASSSEKTEQLLTASGWLRGINGMMAKPAGALVLKLLVPQNDATLSLIAADLRLQWLKLGIQANLIIAPPLTVERLLKEGSFDAVLQRVPLPSSWDLWSEWHSDEPTNLTGVADRQIDLLLEALTREFDPDEASHRCQKLEQMILSEHAVLPLLTLNERTLLRTSLNERASQHQPWTLRDLLIERSR